MAVQGEGNAEHIPMPRINHDLYIQRERRSEGNRPSILGGDNIDIERLQRLADRGQMERLCFCIRPCENPCMWVSVGTLAVGICGLVVYGLTLVLRSIL